MDFGGDVTMENTFCANKILQSMLADVESTQQRVQSKIDNID